MKLIRTKLTNRHWLCMLAFPALLGVPEVVCANPGTVQTYSQPAELQSSISGEAQVPAPIEIKGLVKDSKTSMPIPGASVVIKGTTMGVSTNNAGEFTLNVPDKDVTLIVSFIGYKSQDVKLNNTKLQVVFLEEDVQMLDEAVAIGYQKVTKRNVHGAVTTVNMDELKGVTSPSIDAMLQGVLPGVNIQTFTGEPGGKNTFLVRGNTGISNKDITSDPLFVLDGIPVDASVVGYSATSTNFLSNINPADVESISVLKDASSAAIYGSRAANGVVLIKTKKGVKGSPRISLNAKYGIVTKPAVPKVYAGAAERRMKLEQMLFDPNSEYLWYKMNKNPLMLTDSLNPAFNNSTDWFGLYFQLARIQDYNLSISGGSDNFNYRLSGGYYKETGTIIGSGMSRYSFTANLTNKFWKNRLSFQTSFEYSASTRNPAAGGADASRNAISLSPHNAPSSLFYLNPTDEKVLTGTYNDLRDDNTDKRLRISELITLQLFDFLSFNSSLSLSTYDTRRDYFAPSSISVDKKSEAYSNSGENKSMTIENYFNFDKRFGKDHQLSGLLGISTERHTQHSTYAGGSYLGSDQVQVVTGVKPEYKVATSGFNERSLVGMYARLQYFYKDKYSLSASIRRDGSSTFGPNSRWGNFPSLGAFWIISEENFMENIRPVMSMAKFRASWGRSGQQPEGDPYGYYNRYTVSSKTYNGETVITPNFTDGVAQKDLTWSETREWDFGLDLEFLDGRFFFQTDVYNRETHGLFYNFPLPATSGYEKYNTNAAAVRNAGVEFMLRANLISPAVKDWSCVVTLTASHNKNTIMQLPEGNKTIQDDNRFLTVGQPMNMFSLVKYKGVFSTNEDVPFNKLTGEYYMREDGKPFQAGDPYYEDITGDNKFLPYQDYTFVGDPNPKWTGGLNAFVTYKNWELNVMCSYTLKRDILNLSLAESLNKFNGVGGTDELGEGYSKNYDDYNHNYNQEDYRARRALVDLSDIDFWTKPGDKAKYPSIFSPCGFYNRSSLFLENGSYFKINSLMLSYNFNQLRKYNINNLRLSVSCENVAVFKSKNTHVTDPQNVSPSGEYTGSGYGIPRKFTVGLMFDF